MCVCRCVCTNNMYVPYRTNVQYDIVRIIWFTYKLCRLHCIYVVFSSFFFILLCFALAPQPLIFTLSLVYSVSCRSFFGFCQPCILRALYVYIYPKICVASPLPRGINTHKPYRSRRIFAAIMICFIAFALNSTHTEYVYFVCCAVCHVPYQTMMMIYMYNMNIYLLYLYRYGTTQWLLYG